MDLKSIQVRDRVDQVRGRLPEDLERIEMRRWIRQIGKFWTTI